ncbi:hypothetical protein [Streptomyces sp. NPDC093225]|uniref:hypothetical protein n=1 Tax=Streptomyces sp. NPDC093225 TaxID=3366034 RepID=UPI003812A32E
MTAFKDTVAAADFAELIGSLEDCREVAEETAAGLAAGDEPDLLDPAVPSLYSLCRAFGEDIGQFRLVHDESKVIHCNAALLSTVHRIPDPSEPGRFMPPLMASRIEFPDSTAHPQLQVADWAAGAARQWAAQVATGSRDRFANELQQVALPWVVDAIWPGSTDW